jgi:4-phospho-D-threonate 3-dehydrogenase / 4-phospho-D-erythronate 3-dehydrogenase
MSQPVCAVTMGDPSGIGPEILLKAFLDARVRKACRILAVADYGVMEKAAAVIDPTIKMTRVAGLSREEFNAVSGEMLPVVDLANLDAGQLRYGVVDPDYGRAAYDSILQSIQRAKDGVVDAVVTNPIHKEALNAAGIEDAGHTEIFARQTNTGNYAMMLVHDPLRVVHVSTHLALRNACDAVTRRRVLEVIRLTAGAARSLGGEHAAIAVAGLNPHAGEHGLFGREEIDEIIPAIEDARNEGINAVGPFPPDTLFPRAMSGEFAAVVAMYHDQGHIPLKLAGFRVDPTTGAFDNVSGVNVTLGLPIVRTSVDHGTAFDIAGTGKASHESLVQAIEYAVRLQHDRTP